MKYILIMDGQSELFETILEVIEFLNIHNPENYICFEIAKEIKFARYYKEIDE